MENDSVCLDIVLLGGGGGVCYLFLFISFIEAFLCSSELPKNTRM